MMPLARSRAEWFCRRFGLKLPILLAPMAGASAPSLSIAMMKAGSLGACGALLMQPGEIVAWADEVRAGADGPSTSISGSPIRRRRAIRPRSARARLSGQLGPAGGAERRRLDAAGFCRAM